MGRDKEGMITLRNIRAAIKVCFDSISNVFAKEEIVLISEGSDWVIHEECLVIKNYLESHRLASVRIATTSIGVRKKIVHFFSENTLVGPHGLRRKKKSNSFILSWFHISEADAYRLGCIPLLNTEVDILHTAAEITEKKLIHYGCDPKKVVRIALDVNLNVFHPITQNEKTILQKQLGLPTDKILIGSFQKDGNGWGEGLEPKRIKGPDIFCDVVENLAKHFPIHIVLTGPARGYIKNRLKKSGIPYSHRYINRYFQIAKYFQAIDLYLITSREEGGPKALLESMATGTPLVSTQVGMVPDIVRDGIDAFVVPVGDTRRIEERSRQLIQDATLQASFRSHVLEKAPLYSSENMADRFYKELYAPLLAKLRS